MKYKRIAVVIALCVSASIWGYVFFMPDKYESRAKVHIDTATAIRPLMKGVVVDPDITSMIRIIQQLMFTRPNLEKIVELSLLNQSREAVSSENIEKLKTEITIRSSGNKDIFDIAYSSDDPEIAKSVVQSVLTVFSEQTQGKAQSDASDAHDFIEQQIRDYEIRLQEAEKSREDFTRNHLNLVLESDQVHILQAVKQEIQDAATALQQAQAKKNVLAEQLKEVQASTSDDWGAAAPGAAPVDSRIKSLRDRKADLMLKYTNKHPDIIEIDHLIEVLQNQNQPAKNTTEDAEHLGPEKMSNPYVQTLKTAIDNAGTEVAAAQALIDSLNARKNKLEEGLKEKLTLETEMKNMNRDYETISKQYSTLLERREQAHITERIDDQTSRLKFKIADPPSKPLKPSFPNRVLFYSLALAGGFVSGFGVALLLYTLNPVYMSNKQVRETTGLPSLGSVSYVALPKTAANIDWFFVSIIVVMCIAYSGMMLLELLKK